MDQLLTQLCSIATAPFAEHRVLDFIDQLARRNRWRRRRDRIGNLMLETGPMRGRRLIFVAHADHPGMVAQRMMAPRRLLARFHGGVLTTFVRGAKTRFYSGDSEVRGRVERIAATGERPDLPVEVEVAVAADVVPGSIGMFDLPPARIVGRKFHSRACDDLAGVAAILAAMTQARRGRLRAPVAALITRAEEVGFIGAIAAARSGELIRRDDRLISVECSAMQPYARQGDGVILRVGDRTSIFHSGFTHWMHRECEALAAADRSFKFQRALMPGGSCEGTVFDTHGYVAGAICLPLGNYHNMDRDRGCIAAEYIDLDDWANEVKLFVHLMRRADQIDLKFKPLRARLSRRFAMMTKYL